MKEHLKNFKKSIEAGNVSHAYLFYGAEKEELFSFALDLAKIFLGENAKKSPDFYLIDKGSEAITVDEIRELIRFLSFKPAEFERKIAIIKNAEAMNKNAANAILKALEEPVKGNIIILTTNSVGSILPTALSRVEKVNLFTDSKKYVIRTDKEFKLFKDIANSDIAERMNMAEKISKDGNVIKALENLISFFHDALYAKYSLDEFVENSEYLNEIKKISEKYSDKDLQDIIKRILETSHLLKTTNANERLAFENLLINI